MSIFKTYFPSFCILRSFGLILSARVFQLLRGIGVGVVNIAGEIPQLPVIKSGRPNPVL